MHRNLHLASASPGTTDPVIRQQQAEVLDTAEGYARHYESWRPRGLLGSVRFAIDRELDERFSRGRLPELRRIAEQTRETAQVRANRIEAAIKENRAQAVAIIAFCDPATARQALKRPSEIDTAVTRLAAKQAESEATDKLLGQIGMAIANPHHAGSSTLFNSALPATDRIAREPANQARVVVGVLQGLGFRPYHFASNMTRSASGDSVAEAEIPVGAHYVSIRPDGLGSIEDSPEDSNPLIYVPSGAISLLASYTQTGHDVSVSLAVLTTEAYETYDGDPSPAPNARPNLTLV